MNTQETGQRIARARHRRGLSQAALAGLVGRSESWLSQVERGKRTLDSHTVLTQMAQVLRVDIAELTGSDSDDASPRRPYPSAQEIERAMMSYAALDDSITGLTTGSQCDIRNIETRITTARARYQAARYEEAGRLLPSLINDTETASRASRSPSPDLPRARAHVYDITAALLNRVGEHTLAWCAGDRAIAAAERACQPLTVALCAYRMTYILTSLKHPREAIELATTAADAIARTIQYRDAQPDAISVCGGLHLAAANAAAADSDSDTSASLLGTARQLADQLGRDANLMGTAFGPANVAIHTMSTSAKLGQWATVIRIGESLDAATMPAGLIGRRAQLKLDLARAYAARRQDAAAVNTLLAAEQLSAQLVRFHSSTRDLITALMQREHRASTPQLRSLAHRAGLV